MMILAFIIANSAQIDLVAVNSTFFLNYSAKVVIMSDNVYRG